MAGLYFLVRVFKHRAFIPNSLAWMICIAAGTLTKRAGLPLALAMIIAWIIFIIKFYKKIYPLKFNGIKVYVSSFIFLLLIIGNLAIYGYNLIIYKAITPSCEAILTKEQCKQTQYYRRVEQYALEEKLTISRSKELGYPGPIKYFFTKWIPNFFSRLYGVHGHSVAYFSITMTIAHVILFYWFVAISVIYWRDFNFPILSLLGLFLFYVVILFNESYQSELTFGFETFRIQGRYIIPVIGIAYTLFTKVLMNVPKKLIRLPILIILLLLYFYSGPLTFVLKYSSEFTKWFVK